MSTMWRYDMNYLLACNDKRAMNNSEEKMYRESGDSKRIY